MSTPRTAPRVLCHDHPSRAAVFRCPDCDRAVCADCTNRAWTSTGFIDRCLACDVPLARLPGRRATAARRANTSYLVRAMDAVTLLGHRSSLRLTASLTLLATPLVGIIRFHPNPRAMLFGGALIFALEAIVYLAIIAQTARGQADIHWPDVTDVVDQVMQPPLRYLAATLPIFIGTLFFMSDSHDVVRLLDVVGGQPQALVHKPVPALFIVVGIVLLPLLTIVAATCYSVSAVLSPRVWRRALQVVGSDYFLAMGLFHAVFAVEVFVWLPWLSDLYWQLDIPILVLVVTTFLGYLPMLVRARLLGLLIEPRRELFE